MVGGGVGRGGKGYKEKGAGRDKGGERASSGCLDVEQDIQFLHHFSFVPENPWIPTDQCLCVRLFAA